MKKQVRTAALVTTLLFSVASTSWAASVAANFQGRDGGGSENSPSQTLAPSDVAGVVPQGNWNNINSGGTFKGTSSSMTDSGGGYTAVQVVYDAVDSWNSDGPTATANDKMMKGILKFKEAGGTITWSNLPPSAVYDAYVYCEENGTGAEGRVILGATAYLIAWENAFPGTFTRITDVINYGVGNYVKFDSVSPAPDGTLTITVYKDSIANDGVGIAGVQLVQLSGPAFPPNITPAAITTQPSSITNYAGVPATFTLVATGPHGTQWRKNGVNIPGANGDSYTTPILTMADNLAQFTAVVTNNVNSVTSSPPAIAYLYVNTNACAITLQPKSTLVVQGAPATFTMAYVGPLVQVQWTKNGADILGATGTTLTFTPTLADNNAVIRVRISNNVNTVTSLPATLQVDAPAPLTLTQGFMAVDRWEGIGNATGQAGVNDVIARLGTTPNTKFYVAGPDQPQSNPDISDFGTRIYGWVKPDVSGNYYFFTRSDDSSSLWINATPAGAPGQTNTLPNPADAGQSPIAWEYGCCKSFQETNVVNADGQQTSAAPIPLQAGYLYGFVMLMKEAGGGDWAQCAWRLDGDTTPAGSLKPIGGGNCFTMASGAGHRATLTTLPQNVTVTEDRPATFTAGVTLFPTTDPVGIQWFVNGNPVAGANQNSYTIPSTTLADNGKQIFARFYTLGGVTNTPTVQLNVQADTTAPVPQVATTVSSAGAVTVGVGFDEAVNPATLVAGNFTAVDFAGTYSVKTNTLNTYSGITFEVPGGLTAGTTYHITVRNVADSHGNAIPAGGVTVAFSLGTGAWADTGSPIRPGQVVPVGSDGFDILNGGRAEWGSYDEATIAYARKTNDFDVKVRVMYAEPGSQWTRVGLMARNDLNVGMARDGTDGSAYAQTHVNPSQTLYQSGVWDPADPVTLGNTANSNNGHEQNQRLDTGGQTSGWGSAGTPPTYPNSWLRLKRSGSTLRGFRSTDGVNWTDQGTTTLNVQQPVMHVGPFLAVETGNLNYNGFDVWASPFDARYDRLFVAQFRNYGDVAGGNPVAPEALTISTSAVDGRIVLSWTAGVLQSASVVTGPYTDVPGAGPNTYLVPASGTQLYFRLRGTQ